MGCQQNGPEHGQVQNWYLNEKMVLVPVFFRMRGCCIVLRYFRRDVVDKIFLKYPKEDRSSSSHAGIRNIPADVCYDDTKPYQVPSEKQGRCKVCKKYSRRPCEKYKVNLHYIIS